MYVLQMANNARVLGIVLMHATGTTAGLFEMLKDRVSIPSYVMSSVYGYSKVLNVYDRNAVDAVYAFAIDVCCGVLYVKAFTSACTLQQVYRHHRRHVRM